MAGTDKQLDDVWEFTGDRMIAKGDAAAIDDRLANRLTKIRTGDWRILYQDGQTGEYWELSYPQGEMQGGGPRRLTCLGCDLPAEWR